MKKTTSDKQMSNSGSLRLLLSYVIADKRQFCKTLILVVIATGFDVLSPILGKVFVDEFIVPDYYPPGPVIATIGLFIATVLLATYLNYKQTLKFVDLALNAVLDIRKRAFKHVLSLPVAFFDYARTGQLVSRITNDTESIKDIYVQFLSSVISNLILLIGILLAMAALDVQLMLVALLLIPTVATLMYLYQRFSVKIVAESRQLRSDINGSVNESISGMTVIQATNQQTAKIDQFDHINSRYYTTRIQTMTIGSFLLRPAINFLSIVILAGVVWFFGVKAVQGVAEIGVLYAYLNYLGRFTEPLVEITQRFSLYQQAIVAGNRVYQLLQEPAATNQTSSYQAIEHGRLKIQNVSFGYNPKEPVLKDISLSIQPGQFFAIVGHTGSGKSTLLSLLLNFYQPQSGTITIDGHPLAEYDHDALRHSLGFIPQDAFILASSIFDNIDMDRHLSKATIQRAARQAHLHEVIMELADGYQTQLGEGGLRLSTGQRQQLIIARALAGSPKILILDEATANVDSETEQIVQQALFEIKDQVTVIVVAHRLSTIQHADCILVLDKGQIIEQGNHEELMQQSAGRYRAMYDLQQQEQMVTQASR